MFKVLCIDMAKCLHYLKGNFISKKIGLGQTKIEVDSILKVSPPSIENIILLFRWERMCVCLDWGGANISAKECESLSRSIYYASIYLEAIKIGPKTPVKRKVESEKTYEYSIIYVRERSFAVSV